MAPLERSPTDGLTYMRWAKEHPRPRYDLTRSGLPAIQPEELDPPPPPVPFEVRGSYGDPELMEAVADLYGVAPQRVLPVPGTSCANFIALAAVLNRGDTVLIEHPVYDPIERAARFLGLQVLDLPRRPAERFAVRIDELESLLARGPRAVVLTNLHNPSGQRITRDEMGEIADSCARAGAALMVDEVYLDAAAIVLSEPRWTAASLGDHVVTTNSLTKVYGFGDLRAGWLIGRAEYVERSKYVMDLLSVNNAAPVAPLALCALAQLPALEDRYRRCHQAGQAVFRRWVETLATKCHAQAPSQVRSGRPVASETPSAPGTPAAGDHESTIDNRQSTTGDRPSAIPLSYPNHGCLFECLRLPDGVDSDRFCELLASAYETQVVPGRFFDLPDHIRLMTAVPPDDLAAALSRIERAMGEIAS